MKYILLIIVCVGLASAASAQGYDPGRTGKKAKDLYDRAQRSLDVRNLQEAAAYLDQATKEDPGFLDAFAQLGSLYVKDKKYAEAVTCFDRAFAIDSAYFTPGLLMYAKSEAGIGRFREALHLVTKYLQQSSLSTEDRQEALDWKNHFIFAIQTLQQHIPFAPVNLGDSINTKDPEYLPSLTIDQQTLVFTRNIANRNEDIFISHLRPDGKWGLAEDVGPPISTPQYNEGAQKISQDGNILVYTVCNSPEGMGSCDIYYALKKTGGGWSAPKNIGPPVNSPYWDTQPCLSPDNKDLYFVSNRPGGYGGSDIYVSHLQPDGRWGTPENLGPNVNTSGDESGPFIHADNQTLFFASNGWPGLGGMDLFYTRKQPDGSWGKPVNLGYPINTIDHDGSIFVAADGKTAYFASDRSDSRGQLDLYTFGLYPEARPIRTLYVKGYVYDAKTQQRLPAAIDLVDLASAKTITRIYADQNGDYLVALPVGKDYAFNVSKEGYLFYSDNFSLKNRPEDRPFLINIGLQPIAVHASVVLKNIFFDFDKYELKPESRIELDKLVRLLEENPRLKIRINGHTDNAGTAEHNLTLSQNRAEAVVEYLVSKGIAADRLSSKGFGATRPVASNSTEEGRAQNRRTEFVVTAK